MKKSLLALAVLGAFAGAASAQSSVTVYGIVDASLSSIDNGAERTNGIDSGRNNASRIGFKGVEDLGNGLKAEFVLENGFDVSNGQQSSSASAAFSRLAYVGLNGGFGTVRLGRQNSPIKTALDVIDPFKGAGLAGAIGFIGDGSTPERVSNQITYISNNFGGFQGSVAYSFGEVEGVNSANSGWAAQLGYGNGPLNVQFAYAKSNASDEVAGAAPTTDIDTTNILLGATYDFGAFKLHGGFEDTKFEQNVAPGGEEKIKSYILGATVPFGASAIRASYIRNDADAADADSNVYALSYTYALSKRTTLYTTYVHSSNDDASDVGATGAGDGVAGQSGSGFVVGMQHNF